MDKYIVVTVKANIKKDTFSNNEIKQGIFKGKSVHRTYHTFKVNGEKLAIDIANTCNEYTSKGYELISNTLIESGIYNHDADINSGWGFGVSVTSGVLLTFKKND